MSEQTTQVDRPAETRTDGGSGNRALRTEGERRAQTNVIYPPVDVSEDDHGITLIADLPGVSKDRLNVEVDRDALLIEGDMSLDMPEGMEAVYADLRATHYRRSFALSNELDTDAIEAKISDGVLSVRIPKRQEARPRKIPVRVD